MKLVDAREQRRKRRRGGVARGRRAGSTARAGGRADDQDRGKGAPTRITTAILNTDPGGARTSRSTSDGKQTSPSVTRIGLCCREPSGGTRARQSARKSRAENRRQGDGPARHRRHRGRARHRHRQAARADRATSRSTRLHEHRRRRRARSPSSTARRASCATAASRSRSSAEKSTFVEIAYLLIYGELPNKTELDAFSHAAHAPLADPRGHEALLRRLPVDGAPDGDPVGDGAARCRAYYPEALDVKNTDEQSTSTIARLLVEGADDRGLLLQEVDRPAVHLPAERPLATARTSCT